MASDSTSHLPPKILSFVLYKCESKTLCWSSLTSKEVAGLVFETKHVKIQLPTHADVGPDSIPVWPSGMLNLLRCSSSIDAVTLEFTPNGVQPLLRWCYIDSAFLLIQGNKLLNNKFVFKDFAVSVEENISDDKSSEIHTIFEGCVHYAKLYLGYVADIISTIPNLKTLIVEDSAGRVYVQEKTILEGKFQIPMVDESDSLIHSTLPSIVKLWWSLVVTVPGFLLQEVTIMTSRIISSKFPKGDAPLPSLSEDMKEKCTELGGLLFHEYEFELAAAGN